MISIVIGSAAFSIAIVSNAINSSAIVSSAAIDIMKRFSLRCAAVAICVSATLAGCETVNTTQPGAIGVDRKQVMSPLVSEQELRQGAVTAYKEVLTKEQSKGALNADGALTNRVRAISKRVIPATAAFRSDAPGWAWEVNVIKSDQLNAWCMPGGKIAFYSGIIEKLQLNDDEIAAIMGHEIAHALREHGRERASEGAISQLGIAVVTTAAGGGRAAADMAQVAYGLAFSLPHSRLHETEADRIGVELSARSGYDPRAAIGLWQKMAKISGGKGPEFLSTHPSSDSRIKDLTDYAARVMPLYEKARH